MGKTADSSSPKQDHNKQSRKRSCYEECPILSHENHDKSTNEEKRRKACRGPLGFADGYSGD